MSGFQNGVELPRRLESIAGLWSLPVQSRTRAKQKWLGLCRGERRWQWNRYWGTHKTVQQKWKKKSGNGMLSPSLLMGKHFSQRAILLAACFFFRRFFAWKKVICLSSSSLACHCLLYRSVFGAFQWTYYA